MASKPSSGLAETVRTLIYAVLIALVIRTFLFEPFSIPSGSMEPTLLVGDYLFVSKYSYGYSRYSFPLGLPLLPGPGRMPFRQPERGDVVVFKLPRDNSTDYIKRLIGLPGDHVQVKQGVLYINGEAAKRERTGTYIYTDSRGGGASALTEYVETLPNGRKHLIALQGDDQPAENTEEFIVPDGTYFMMGDDRDKSADSRIHGDGVGYVPAENLVGHAQFLFFSTNNYAEWWEIWKWPFTIRYDRLFTAIH